MFWGGVAGLVLPQSYRDSYGGVCAQYVWGFSFAILPCDTDA